MKFDQVYIHIYGAYALTVRFEIMRRTGQWHMDADAAQMRMPLSCYSAVLVF